MRSTAGAKIIQHSLSRDLDGEFDRMAAIMLGLLDNDSTREIGTEMLQEIFTQKIQNRNKKEVDFPIHTIALIAQMNFDHRLAPHLWNAVPKKQRKRVQADVLAYSLMDSNEGWADSSRKALSETGSAKSLSQSCLYVISELWGMFGKDTIEGKQLDLWVNHFPWLVQKSFLRSISEHDKTEMHFLEKMEWASAYCPLDPGLDMNTAIELGGLDIENYPRLVQIGVATKRRELTRIAGERVSYPKPPPAI